MKIKYKHGLLLVDRTLNYSGKSKQIKNMVLDTGAARTLISQDAVDEIGLEVGLDLLMQAGFTIDLLHLEMNRKA